MLRKKEGFKTRTSCALVGIKLYLTDSALLIDERVLSHHGFFTYTVGCNLALGFTIGPQELNTVEAVFASIVAHI